MNAVSSYTQIGTEFSQQIDHLRKTLPAKMLNAKRWMQWKLVENREPGKKPRKIPYYTTHQTRGVTDTEQDARLLGTFDQACAAICSGLHDYAGLGFALGRDGDGYWQGVDFDDVHLDDELRELAYHAPGYVESSPSMNGYHAIGYGKYIQTTDAKNEAGIEIYASGRFFTVTGIDGEGELCDLSGFVNEKILPRISKKKGAKAASFQDRPAGAHVDPYKAQTPRPKENISTKQLEDLKSALSHINADDHGDWIAVGIALSTVNGGEKLWLDWSKTSAKFRAEDALRWHTFKADKTNWKSIFTLAQENGWINPRSNSSPLPVIDITTGEVIYRQEQTSRTPARGADMIADLLSMSTTDEMMAKVQSAKFAWRRLVVQGHICAMISKPNGGKTTIMTFAAGEMVRAGYRVLYFNLDAGAADLKYYHQHARDHGYDLIAPDMFEGRSVHDVLEILKKLAQSDEDQSNVVMLFDTLKKFTDVMSKTHGKVFYALLRKLTARGMTAVLLGHTNKYEDQSGKPIFEGTGDLKNDIDELVYLIPIKNDDGSMTVSTVVDKSRAETQDETFYITPDRQVSIKGDYVNTLEENHARHQMSIDRDVIGFIQENISTNCKSLTELHGIAKETKAGFSRNRLEAVLKRYCGEDNPLRKWERASAVTGGYVYFIKK